MIKKLIEKLFGKRCACKIEKVCDHANNVSKKVKNIDQIIERVIDKVIKEESEN